MDRLLTAKLPQIIPSTNIVSENTFTLVIKEDLAKHELRNWNITMS